MRVRKAAQCLAFLGPAACLLAAGTMEPGTASVGELVAACTYINASTVKAAVVRGPLRHGSGCCLHLHQLMRMPPAASLSAVLVTLALGLASFSLAGLVRGCFGLGRLVCCLAGG